MTAADKNRHWVLSARPKEMVERENFEWREEPVPQVGEGEFLVRNLWLSCDPAQRAWMEIDTYIPALPLGEVMLSGSGGEVVESKHPDFAEGDLVTGAFGWQEYAVSDGGSGFFTVNKIPPGVELPTALSLFGISGLTAYVGLLDIGQPKPGETVLVSGAAGSVGSLVAQIAKIKDCRVVGIAGGAAKSEWLTNELGIDGAIDYKGEDVPGPNRRALSEGRRRLLRQRRGRDPRRGARSDRVRCACRPLRRDLRIHQLRAAGWDQEHLSADRSPCQHARLPDLRPYGPGPGSDC
jgi:NADPH-dependent curcumin reductase CurA